VNREGKPTKVPLQADTLDFASVTDPATWATADAALIAAHANPSRVEGIGIVLGELPDGKILAGIDLDKKGDKLPAVAEEILARKSSYAERSPSGGGIHVLGFIGQPFTGGNRRGSIERYYRKRFFTFTGNRIDGAPEDLADISWEINRLGQLIDAPKNAGPNGIRIPVGLDDSAIIEKAKAAKNGAEFSRLYAGDTSGHGGDDSAADLALCSRLAFWLNRDGARIDAAFRRSGLYRKKWEREDYRRRTIAKAIEGCAEVYDPSRNGNGKHKSHSGKLPDREPAKASPKRQPAGDLLLEIIRTRCTLWRDPSYRAFASIGWENFPIRGSLFARLLAGAYYAETGGAAPREAMQGAIDAADAMAVHDPSSTVHEVCVRVGFIGDMGYLDLADTNRTVIKFGVNGWEVAGEERPKFVRPAGMLPLPIPTRGGSVELLRPILNIPDDGQWTLYCGLAQAVFQRDGTRPIGAFSGENGSGKTFAARCLKYIVDPSKAGLRQAPKDTTDLLLCANNNALVALDNISHLSDDLADTICRLTSGGGIGKRRLYSNDEETIIDVIRPVIVTSIPSLLTRDDFADRALDLNFPPIADEKRRAENELLAELERIRPAVLGSLLEAAGAGIPGAAAVKLRELPRLADFTKFVEAGGVKAWGWMPGHFTRGFLDNRKGAAASAVERSTVGGLILQLLATSESWEGTASELYDDLDVLADDKIRRRKDFPGSPDSLSTRLRRLAPQLRKQGIDVDTGRDTSAERRRVITISRPRPPNGRPQVSEVSEAPEPPPAPDTPDTSSPALTDDYEATERAALMEPGM